ncbi:MAG: helix-turn-helix domain-containing protein [Candidatus Limnocylindrales bacterium]
MDNNPKALLDIVEAADRLSISRSKLYALVAAGEVESVKIGKSRRIPAAAINRFVGRLLAEQTPEPRTWPR